MRTKLNESYLRRVVKESINKVLREGDNKWEDAYMDNNGYIIQSMGSGAKKQWRKIKKKVDYNDRDTWKDKNNNGWKDVYKDKNIGNIQSKGSGANKQWRTKK
jgi:hypothetical protein